MISAYESGRRQPSLPALLRLVRAAGLDVHLGLRDLPASARPEADESSPSGPAASAAAELTPVQTRVLRALSRAPLGLEGVGSVAYAAGLEAAEAAEACTALRARGLLTVEEQVVPGVTAHPVEVWQANVLHPEWGQVSRRSPEAAPRNTSEPPVPAGRSAAAGRVPDRVAHLFWNAPLHELTVSGHAAYIAGRVLRSDDVQALAWAAQALPAEAWGQAAQLRGLDPSRRALARNVAASRA